MTPVKQPSGVTLPSERQDVSADTPEEASITFTHSPTVTIWNRLGIALPDMWLIQSPSAAGGFDHCVKRALKEELARDVATCNGKARELHVDDETAFGLFFCGLATAEHLEGHEETAEYIRLGRPIEIGGVGLTVYIMRAIHCSYVLTDGLANPLLTVEY